MGFRFRKSFKIAPGVKVNFNKKSTGITFGGKGFHYTVNSKGKRTTSVGIPETGLSYSATSGGHSKKKTKKSQGSANVMDTANTKKWYQKTGYIILLLVLFFPVGLFLMWKYTDWNKNVKIAISAILAVIFGISMISSSGSDDPENTNASIDSSITETTSNKETSDSELNEKITVQDETTTLKETTTNTPENTTKNETTTVERTTETTTKTATTTKPVTTTKEETTPSKPAGHTVYITPTGKRYHFDPNCGGKNSYSTTMDKALSYGLTPCQKCTQ